MSKLMNKIKYLLGGARPFQKLKKLRVKSWDWSKDSMQIFYMLCWDTYVTLIWRYIFIYIYYFSENLFIGDWVKNITNNKMLISGVPMWQSRNESD